MNVKGVNNSASAFKRLVGLLGSMVTLVLVVTGRPLGAALTAAGEPELTTAIEDVAAKVGPAVVSIQSEKIQRQQVLDPLFGSAYEDQLIDKFFSDFFGSLPEKELKKAGLGSGVIIDPRGFILTNAHVVEDTDKIKVTLADGREFSGTIQGTDSRSDLAVIKIAAENLPVVALEASDHLKIGQWVVAIGYPFGYLLPNTEPAVTTGVISALHRTLPRAATEQDTDYSDLIQTDAVINPGNSGGPLVNLKGDIIGINVAIFSTSGGYQGIGFAIPSSSAKRIVDKLIEGKQVDYGWIGVSIQDLNESLAEYFNVTNRRGVVISKVLAGTPAAKAGLKEGDVILKVNDKEMKNSGNLTNLIGNTPIGTETKIKILRDDQEKELTVTVAKRPGLEEDISVPVEEEKEEELTSNAIAWRGLTIQDIPPNQIVRTLTNLQGVMVTDIDTKSAAFIAGVRKGDIIDSINKLPVTNLKEFNTRIKKATGDCLVRTTRGLFVVPE